MTESATPATTPAPRPEKPRVPERAEFRFWTEEKLREMAESRLALAAKP